MGVTVYGSGASQPTRAVMWTAKLIGLDAQLEAMDMMKGDHLAAKYRSELSPAGKIPALRDGDVTLWESHAIMRYLVEKFGDDASRAGLYPTGDLATRARIDAWLDWKHSNVRVGAAGVVRRAVFAKIMKDYSKHSMSYDIVEIPKAREERILMQSLELMEAQLGKTAFLVSAAPSLADIALFTEVDQLRVLPADIEPPVGNLLEGKFPNVHRWLQAMRALPGFAETHKGLNGMVKGVEKMRAASKL